ncbi:PPE family protein [Mycobacterium sp. 29Ha]|uniref:PPE family protein n=1 Tax=Mycobacterium sp. 29Ha TaxID=2939268 RepID=UPI00293952FA|nr:PPE family protein [Mycobacterium sp. 29Ha]MDV3133308.1 PPE family protein [Mycobacterium sp. 29Ha]
MVGVAFGADYGGLPPEINSGRIWAGPGSGALAESAAAWQALAAEMGSAGMAMQAVLEALGTSWLGPSSMTMAMAAAPYVAWMVAVAGQCQEAAVAAGQAAMAFEAAHAGVVPPPEIEENRTRLAALIATNFPFNQNAAAIAATEADYDRMWAQDATVLYGYATDAAGVTGSLVPFMPPAATANPAGFAGQAASVAQASGTAAGNVAEKASTAGTQASQMGGTDAQTMLSMGPQLMGTIPSVLQGFAQPAMGGLSAPMQSLGQFGSLMSPFMGMMGNPGLTSGLGAAAPVAAAAGGPALGAGMGGLGGAGGGISAGLGGAGRLGGLSVPATWAASSQGGAVAAEPLSVTGGASAAAAPASGGGAGMGGGAPVAAMAPRDSEGGSGEPRYGTPVRVLPRPR